MTTARGAVHRAEAEDRPWILAPSLFALGVAYLRRGDVRDAIAVLERGLDIARGRDIPVWLGMTASALGAAYAQLGRIGEALPLLERAIEDDAALGAVKRRALLLAWLGEAYLVAGRFADAGAVAARAREFARAHKERGHEAWCLRLLGEIVVAGDQPDVGAAEAQYQAAMTLASQLGMRPLVARCRLGLGVLHNRVGHIGQARQHLTIAADMLRSMHMTYWLSRTEKVLGPLSNARASI